MSSNTKPECLTHGYPLTLGASTTNERAALRLDDWADVRWLLVRIGNERFFWADGRDVSKVKMRLMWKPGDRSLTATNGDRRAAKAMLLADSAAEVVAAHPGIKRTDLIQKMRGDKNNRPQGIEEAARQGLIRVEQRGRSFHHYPVVQAISDAIKPKRRDPEHIGAMQTEASND